MQTSNRVFFFLLLIFHPRSNSPRCTPLFEIFSPARAPGRQSSFEVVLIDAAGASHVLHSKLKTSKWADTAAVVEAVRAHLA